MAFNNVSHGLGHALTLKTRRAKCVVCQVMQPLGTPMAYRLFSKRDLYCFPCADKILEENEANRQAELKEIKEKFNLTTEQKLYMDNTVVRRVADFTNDLSMVVFKYKQLTDAELPEAPGPFVSRPMIMQLDLELESYYWLRRKEILDAARKDMLEMKAIIEKIAGEQGDGRSV